jgi:hypothetical protein
MLARDRPNSIRLRTNKEPVVPIWLYCQLGAIHYDDHVKNSAGRFAQRLEKWRRPQGPSEEFAAPSKFSLENSISHIKLCLRIAP